MNRFGFPQFCMSPDDGGTGTAMVVSGGNAPASDPSTDFDDLFDIGPSGSDAPANPADGGQGNQGTAVVPQGGSGGTPPATSTPAGAVTSPATTQPATNPPTPQEDPRDRQIAVLQRQLDQLTGYVAAAPQNQPPAQTGQQQQERLFTTQLPALPRPIAEAIISDDPQQRVAALYHWGNIVGNHVGEQALQQVGGVLRHMMEQAIPTLIQQHNVQQRAMQEWHDTFYKEYPGLGKAQARKAAVARAWEEMRDAGIFRGEQDWNPDFRFALAKHAMRILGVDPNRLQRSGQAQAPRQQAPQMTSNGSRPPVNAGPIDENSPEGIMDILGIT